VMIIFLSFDFDAESAEMYYYSDQPVKISRARFSVRKGLFRVLNLLDEFNIKTTFFTPGWVAENYPSLIKSIIAKGHEIGLHGYRHEKLNELPYEEEKKIHEKSIRILKTFSEEIYGFRRPYWEITEHTLKILVKNGIIYDSSLMDDDEPYIIKIDSYKLVELPVYDIYDDWILFELEHRTPLNVLRLWKYELDAAIESELNYFCLVLHPACIGRIGRLLILREFIKYAINKKCKFERGSKIAMDTMMRLEDD